MNKISRGFLFVLTFFMLAAAHAATVYLVDGSLVKGTVVSATAAEVEIHTPNGVLKIPSERIQRIDYLDQPTTPTENAPPTSSARRHHDEEDVRREGRGDQEFSLLFGLGIPLSEINFAGASGGRDSNGGAGPLLGVQYAVQTAPRWWAGVDVSYWGRGTSDSTSLLPFADTFVSGNSLLMMATLKYELVGYGSVRPYIMGGFGANRTSTIVDAQPQAGFTWDDTETDETRRVIDDRHWGTATEAKIGLEFGANRPSVFNLEMGWLGLSNHSYAATPAGEQLGLNEVSGKISGFTIAGRWSWRY